MESSLYSKDELLRVKLLEFYSLKENLEILKETLCDMYLLSKCEKIYRIANWFSAFLSFSCLYNQTNVSNTLRYYPEYPILPL